MSEINPELSAPILLTDKSRLQEIYELRVLCWENSKHSNIINHQKYPNGFKDEFDEESIHLIITHADGQIVAACRVTIFDSLLKFPYVDIPQLETKLTKSFGLIGRGVHKKQSGGHGLQYILVKRCLEICKERGLLQATGHAYNGNNYMQKLMLDLGFKFSCDVGVNNYNHKNIAYPGKLFIADL